MHHTINEGDCILSSTNTTLSAQSSTNATLSNRAYPHNRLFWFAFHSLDDPIEKANHLKSFESEKPQAWRFKVKQSDRSRAKLMGESAFSKHPSELNRLAKHLPKGSSKFDLLGNGDWHCQFRSH